MNHSSTATRPTADASEILRALALLLPPDGIAEFRVLAKGRGGRTLTDVGYFDAAHREDLAALAERLSNQGKACYVVANAIDPSLLARAANEMVPGGAATQDANITGRRWLLVDIDPERPSGISATDAEKLAAKDVAKSIVSALRADGWPDPIVADSGNGWHVLYRIDEPNDDATRDLLKTCLVALGERFDVDAAHVDRSMFNASRIIKLYGTISAKGSHIPERPHRLARLAQVPGSPAIVSRAQLEALAASASSPEPVAARRSRAPRADGADPFASVNDAAMHDLAAWVPALLPAARPHGGGYRVASRDLGRDLEEDVAFHPQGIRDHGTERGLTPIDAVLEFGTGIADAAGAMRWLADRLGIEIPERGRRSQITTTPEDHQATPAPAPSGDLDAYRRRLLNARAADFSSNQIGEKLLGAFGNVIRHCEGIGWLHWDGRVWNRDEAAVRALAHIIADDLQESVAGRSPDALKRRLSSNAYATAALARAECENRIRVKPHQLNADDWLLNTPTGIVDLRSGEITPHDPAKLCTRITTAAPSFSTDRAFLSRVLAEITCGRDDLAAALQEMLGYCCTGDTRLHFFQFWHGPGRNGKNALGDAVLHALGSYATVVPASRLMDGKHEAHLEWLARLLGVRLAISSEVGDGTRWNEAQLKSLTGDSDITANFMRQDSFTFRRTHKHLVYGNHRPSFSGSDRALVSRIRAVPFDAVFSPDVNPDAEPVDHVYPQDPEMPAKMHEAQGMLLSWMIEGAARLHRRGLRLTESPAITTATAEYSDAMNTFASFIDEQCQRCPDTSASSSAIYQRYKEWAERSGLGALSIVRFADRMREQGFRKRTVNGRAEWLDVTLR